MKRLLIIGLLALPTAALAAEPGLRECRVLAADEWVAMGVTSIAGCVRYAESAATPDEPQYAQFGALSLMVRDGQYFQSNDGVTAWKRIQPFSSSPVMSTLNSLKTPGAPDAVAEAVPEPAQKAPVSSPAPASVPEPKPVVVTEAPRRVQVPVPAGVTPPAPNPPVEVAETLPLPAPAIPERAPLQSEPVSAGSVRPCQIKIYQEWQATPAESLQRCAELVYARMSTSRRTQANGYWDGMYLVVSQNSIFKSRNGQDWTPLKE